MRQITRSRSIGGTLSRGVLGAIALLWLSGMAGQGQAPWAGHVTQAALAADAPADEGMAPGRPALGAPPEQPPVDCGKGAAEEAPSPTLPDVVAAPGSGAGPAAATAAGPAGVRAMGFSPMAGPTAMTIYTVTTTADSGPGSLRDAITFANSYLGGTTTILFQIPSSMKSGSAGAYVFALLPQSPLPALTRAGTVIDAGSQTAWGGDINLSGPEVMIYGYYASLGANGLTIQAPGCAVKSLVICRFRRVSNGTEYVGGNGVLLSGTGAQGSRVEGCYIGTDPTGRYAYPNEGHGVFVAGASGCTIGGTTAASRNVISGNGTYGVYVKDPTASGNQVLGNYIGTNAAGNSRLPNSSHGVCIYQAPNNQVGGTAEGSRNLISGNNYQGMWIYGASATGNQVAGNYFGLGADGSTALRNSACGIVIESAAGNTIGGLVPEARNVITGNGNQGIWIGNGATGNLVQGNYIGTNAAGTATPLTSSNASNGVVLNGAGGNTVGGTAPDAGNVISGNAGNGVGIWGSAGNVVQGNLIGTDATGTIAHANGSSGVYLEGASNSTIGGASSGARNVLAGNRYHGVQLKGYTYISSTGTYAARPCTGNTVSGNYIGTRADGAGAVANGYYGVMLDGACNNTVGTGNVISGNPSCGVYVYGFYNSSSSGTYDFPASGNTVAGNLIGTTADGAGALGNAYGVYLTRAPGCAVGGPSAADRNVIADSYYNGVVTYSPGTLIQGNYVGTDAAGMVARANSRIGTNYPAVYVSAPNCTVIGNLISGNLADGVYIPSGTSTGVGVQIVGNKIGTNVTGMAAIPNSYSGVSLSGSGTTVRSNILGGNVHNGVWIGPRGTGNSVVGNYIGAAPFGTAVIGNTRAGVCIAGGTGNTIGGTAPGAGNVIANNTWAGVTVSYYGTPTQPTATANTIRGNSIYANAGLGIDLVPANEGVEGLTLNDPDDADIGPNNLQNFPVLERSSIFGGHLLLTGFARPGAELDFFIADPDPTGCGEGKTYLLTLTEGSADDLDATTGSYDGPFGADATNRFRFWVPLPAGLAPGASLTATATLDGATSEFSPLAGTDERFHISGTVTNGSDPVSGVTVRAIDAGTGAVATSAVTDDEGKYVLDDLLAGDYKVRPVKAPLAFQPPQTLVTVGPDKEDVDFVAMSDTAPPAWTKTGEGVNAEGKQFFEFTCRDIGSGLAAISTGSLYNAGVSIAPFTPDTIEPVVVTVTREDNSLGAGALLEATDAAGSKSHAGPAFFAIRDHATPVSFTFAGVLQSQCRLTVVNGTPGVTNLSVLVNDRRFEVAGLPDGETRVVDLSAAMVTGANTITLEARGKPGGTAMVVFGP